MTATRTVVAVVACGFAGAAAFACLRVARAETRPDDGVVQVVGIVPPLPLPPPPQPAPWLQIPSAPATPAAVPDGFPPPAIPGRPRPVVADFVPKPLPRAEVQPPPAAPPRPPVEVPVVVLDPVPPRPVAKPAAEKPPAEKPPAEKPPAAKPAGKPVLWPTPPPAGVAAPAVTVPPVTAPVMTAPPLPIPAIAVPVIEPAPPALPAKSAAPVQVSPAPPPEIRLPPVEPQLNVKPVEPVITPIAVPLPEPAPVVANPPPLAPAPKTPPPGDSPVPLTLKQTTLSALLGTLMVTAPTLPAAAQEPKPEYAKADDLKAIKTQLEELKALKTQVEELKAIKTQVEEMKRTHEEIKTAVASLKSSLTLLREAVEGKGDGGTAGDGLMKAVKKLESTVTGLDTKLAGMDAKLAEKTRVANSSPVAAAKGVVRIVNEYPVQISMLINGTPHRVEANASKDVSVPSGTFDYQLLTSGADRVTTPLKADETLTLRVK